MAIAGMRDSIMKNHDLSWYIVHFYCSWAVVSAAVTYATRFNDNDLFHNCLWSCFLGAMVMQVAFLNKGMMGFATSTVTMYLLIVVAYIRVSYHLPRARSFSLFHAASHLVAVALLAFPAAGAVAENSSGESVILWIHAFVEVVSICIFMYATRSVPSLPEASAASDESLTTPMVKGVSDNNTPEPSQRPLRDWDVPVSIIYMVRWRPFLAVSHITSCMPRLCPGPNSSRESAFPGEAVQRAHHHGPRLLLPLPCRAAGRNLTLALTVSSLMVPTREPLI